MSEKSNENWRSLAALAMGRALQRFGEKHGEPERMNEGLTLEERAKEAIRQRKRHLDPIQ